MTISTRFAALAAAGVLAVAATPAFAHGLGLNLGVTGDTDSSVHVLHSDASVTTHTNAAVDADHDSDNDSGKIKLTGGFNGLLHSYLNKYKHGSGSVVTGSGSVSGSGSLTVRTAFVTRTNTMLGNLFSYLGKTAKKICQNENSDTGAVQTCMNAIKASFSAKINAALDAAFSI